MNFSLQNVDKVNALLTVNIEKADYQADVDKSLKSLRKNAQIPGFRKGMVPMSLVQKMYRKSVIAEQVNRLISEKIFSYIKDNQINMLGEPLPNEEKQPVVDFDTMEDFEFVFDIAIAPEFEVAATAEDHVPYYTINVADDVIDNQVKMYAERNGKHEQVENYQDKDMLKGLLVELDENGSPKEGGVQVEEAVLMPIYMKDDAQKAIFADAKVNDVLVFAPHTAYAGHEAEIASLLKIEKEKVGEYTGNFSYQIQEITRFVAGELNQELFDQVFPAGEVKSVDEFRAKIKADLEKQYLADTDYRFLIDAREVLINKVGKLEFPDALLKRIMLLNNSEKGESFVEEHYEKSIEELTWHLIKEKLVKAYGVEVQQEDLIAMAKDIARAQFAQYGMTSIPDDILDGYAKEMLGKKESVENILNRAVDAKLAIRLKEDVTLDAKTVSIEEFGKLFE